MMSKQYPGYVQVTDGCLYDPTKISNVRRTEFLESEKGTGQPLQRFEVDFYYDGFNKLATHHVYCLVGRDFQSEVDQALQERQDPKWQDPIRK
jgi:hypothetical protein